MKKHGTYLRATKTLNARSAAVPNTFWKNKAATVTPEDSIWAYQKQRSDQSPQDNRQSMRGEWTHLGRRAEIRDIGKEIESSADTQSKGSGNHESPHRISDVVKNIISIRPPRVREEDFEGCCRILHIVVDTQSHHR